VYHIVPSLRITTVVSARTSQFDCELGNIVILPPIQPFSLAYGAEWRYFTVITAQLPRERIINDEEKPG